SATPGSPCWAPARRRTARAARTGVPTWSGPAAAAPGPTCRPTPDPAPRRPGGRPGRGPYPSGYAPHSEFAGSAPELPLLEKSQVRNGGSGAEPAHSPRTPLPSAAPRRLPQERCAMPQQTVTVNGRDYRTPQAPVVVVCIDGSEPDYHEKAIAAGRMPFLAGLRAKGGAFLDAECAMPSFTNPNNLSIATGVPPAVHGICGNYFYDPDSGEEVMMNAPGLLRAPTLFAAFAEAGRSVAVVTAKD